MPDPTTLLEQLDAAETRLIQAEYRLESARRGAETMLAAGATYKDAMDATRAAEIDLMAAAAHAQIVAVRCMVSIEETGEGNDGG